MKYIRTYETEEKSLTDKDSTSRELVLKPTLYKYSDTDNEIYLELDDPRKHGDSTYMEITLDSDVEFSFYIGNAPDDAQTTMNCSIDWGDDTVETRTITADDKGFKLSHSYVAGSYKIELYGVERDYSVVGSVEEYISLISPVESVMRVVLGSGVVSIGGDAFNDCESLTSINIPNSVTYIGDHAFYYCISLTSINIPNSVTYIGDHAFYYCISLTSINIPNSVTLIGEGAFDSCYSLTSVVLPNNATISSDAFYETGIKPTIDGITYRIDTLIVDNYTFNSTGFLTFYLNGNFYFPDGNVVVYSCDKSKSGDLIIPSTISYNDVVYNVTGIREYAFGGCTDLTSINIPESVISIGDGEFSNCIGLASINIPESVISIGDYAFGGCSSLKSISSFSTTTPTLGGGVFTGLPKNGILHIKPGATGYDAWLSALPSGWTIVEDL